METERRKHTRQCRNCWKRYHLRRRSLCVTNAFLFRISQSIYINNVPWRCSFPQRRPTDWTRMHVSPAHAILLWYLSHCRTFYPTHFEPLSQMRPYDWQHPAECARGLARQICSLCTTHLHIRNFFFLQKMLKFVIINYVCNSARIRR